MLLLFYWYPDRQWELTNLTNQNLRVIGLRKDLEPEILFEILNIKSFSKPVISK